MKRIQLAQNVVLIQAVALVISFAPTAANAQTSDEEELAQVYGDKAVVTITTGAPQPVARAPAVATVILSDDIEAMGATDLDEILETVPGVHVSHSALGYVPIYSIRGISSQYNQQVLMLVNGIPMTSVFVGDRGHVWRNLPVENIARVEIIRGPGSALYGADAFAGVINIVTKQSADIRGTALGARAGSFRSNDAWLLHGGQWGPFDAALYLRRGTSDGAKEKITSDAQSSLDALFGTRASLAPDNTNLGYDAIDAALDLGYQHWRGRLSLKRRQNAETGPGIAQALDPVGRNFGERFTADLTYRNAELAKDWDVTLQGSYFHLEELSSLVLFPPGAFGGAFPQGMIGNPGDWERHLRLVGSAFYTGFDKHRIRIGAGREKDDLYRIRESKNYTYAYIPGVGNVPVPLGSVVDVTGTNAFMTPRARSVSHVYAQDEWNFTKDWYLTGGVRHDRYTDFGGTTNPRLALVWEAAYNVTAKLLAGRAFRPPSFQELYNANNPVAIGNPNLRPETISTIEAAVSWQPSGTLQVGANVFRYRMRDIIRLVANADPTTGFTAQNTGEQTGRGLEFEASWAASRSVRLSGNYAYQKSTDKRTDTDAGDAPHHHLYLRGDWRFAPGWMGNVQANRIAGRNRVAGDARPEVPDYHTVDFTVRKGTVGPGRWDLSVSLRNAFNARVLEPSPAPGNIPFDFPMAGRNLYLQARYGL